jgi:hypothetical protein
MPRAPCKNAIRIPVVAGAISSGLTIPNSLSRRSGADRGVSGSLKRLILSHDDGRLPEIDAVKENYSAAAEDPNSCGCGFISHFACDWFHRAEKAAMDQVQELRAGADSACVNSYIS